MAKVKGNRPTKLRVVKKQKNPTKKIIRLEEGTYQRLKRNSEMYGDKESYDKTIIRLLDVYEKNNKLPELTSLAIQQLQRAMDRQSRFINELSNMLKKINETAQIITQNLK